MPLGLIWKAVYPTVRSKVTRMRNCLLSYTFSKILHLLHFPHPPKKTKNNIARPKYGIRCISKNVDHRFEFCKESTNSLFFWSNYSILLFTLTSILKYLYEYRYTHKKNYTFCSGHKEMNCFFIWCF